MSHYEKSLQADLDKIRTGVLDVARAVDVNLQDALRALMEYDRDLAYATILRDHPINRAVEGVDDICHHFVVRHLPSAGHLRFVSSVLRMTVELERIGDYAETICQEVASLSSPVTGQFRHAVDVMGHDALDMYRNAITAFADQNVEQARATKLVAKNIERDFHVAYEQLAVEGETGSGSARDRFSKLVVLSMLERVADQAKNLCEEVVWALIGERKKRRPMRVLFLDKTNELFGPLAVAAGRKTHPNSGRYEMASRKPAAAIKSDVALFLEGIGDDVDGLVPQVLDGPAKNWADYDIIVALEGNYADYVSRVPFNSVGLSWVVGESGDGVETVYRNVLAEVVRLMDVVRGAEVGDA